MTYDGYKPDALYFSPNGNLAFLVTLGASNAFPGSLTADTNCINLGHIEEEDSELDESNLKFFKNCNEQEIGAKVTDKKMTYNLKLMQKDEKLITYLESVTGTATLLLGIYHGIMQSKHVWEFAVVRNGSKIKLGSKDESTEFIGNGVYLASGLSILQANLEAIETALSITIHPTSAAIGTNKARVLTYTAVS